MSTRSSTSKTGNDNLTATLQLEDRIRERAYELYLERGAIDGYELEDWLQAQSEVTGKKVKSTAA